MDTILKSVKELLGVPDEVKEFDVQLMMHINSVFMVLNDLGVGPDAIYIATQVSTIDDFLPYDEGLQAIALMYIYTKVRILFDPPTTSFVLTALGETIKEYEWRLTDAKESSS